MTETAGSDFDGAETTPCRRQLCFVLTTATGDDRYVRMLVLAVRSVRAAMPDAHLILLVDEASQVRLGDSAAAVPKLFDTVTAVTVPQAEAAWVSRYLKTGVRAQVDGDVLFLDADVVVREDLAALWRCRGDVGAVPDANADGLRLRPWQEQRYRELGWSLPTTSFVNSGVVFWRDTPVAHAVADRYRARWLESYERLGVHFDQHALNTALADVGAHLELFDHRYNAQGWFNPGLYYGGAVWHFYSSNMDKKRRGIETHWHRALAAADPLSVPLDWIRRQHPLRLDRPCEHWALRSLRRQGTAPSVKDWRHLWLERRYRKALKGAVIAGFRNALGDSARWRSNAGWEQR